MTKAVLQKEEIKTNGEKTSANLPIRQKKSALTEHKGTTSPFTMMRHIAEDMENMITDFSLGNMFFAPDLYRNFLKPDFSFLNKAPFLGEIGNFFNEWSPEVEMFDRDGKLVVQADLPGIKKDDIKVDITDRHLTIRGERKEEREEKDEGFYRSERTYGSFRREIPLPNGVKTDKAKAEFKNGVLEIAMEAPDLATRKRRLEIVGDESAKAVPK